ncbi:phage recombination protein Bet [Comamonas jiangduensis]|uniref:phage recombination protein Bet n=1 Tax=Comamonas jiangduensis TaxID=1194168 RepID=UPI003BF80F65
MSDTQTALRELSARLATRLQIDQQSFIQTVKSTAFKQSDNVQITDEQMLALLIVADQYKLNPFTKELYAYPDTRNGGVIPVVSVDGWIRIINEHPEFDGVEFNYSSDFVLMEGACAYAYEWAECSISRKDRSKPIVVREYLDECYRAPFKKRNNNSNTSYAINGPWQTHPKRLLRHKSLIQTGRVAFGFAGIYDADEAMRILDSDEVIDTPKVVGRRAADVVSGDVAQHESQVVESADAHEVVQVRNQGVPALPRPEVDAILSQLLVRVKAHGAWEGAYQYVEARMTGEDQKYALEHLKRMESELSCNAQERSADETTAVADPAEGSVAASSPRVMPQLADPAEAGYTAIF